MATLEIEVTWSREPAPEEICMLFSTVLRPSPTRVTFPDTSHVIIQNDQMVALWLNKRFKVIDEQLNDIGIGRIVG